MVALGSASNGGHGELQGLWGFIGMCFGVICDRSWVSGMIRAVSVGSYRGCGVFVEMCVVAVHDRTWVSMLSFSCDRLGSGFAFITLSTSEPPTIQTSKHQESLT